MHMSCGSRFQKFIRHISLTETQKSNGRTAAESVVSCLNRHYWNVESGSANRLYVGSWGKFTRVRPPRDVDLVFSLPWAVYERFGQRQGNIQSQILQEVRQVLLGRFPNSDVRGSGPIVSVPHYLYDIEIIPAFHSQIMKKSYLLCSTKNGGSWLQSDYATELGVVQTSDTAWSGNTRHLIKMMKQWQRNCDVNIKSFWLELLAVEFLRGWQYRGNGFAFYDWMVRDFLEFMIGKRDSNLYSPGTLEVMFIGSAWLADARKALNSAKKACELEATSESISYLWWRDLFGGDYPSE